MKDKPITIIQGHKCLGYKYWTDCGYEYDCEYESDILCEDCIFVVASESGDKRKGKKPWAKCYEDRK
jgi:hypothetical protein